MSSIFSCVSWPSEYIILNLCTKLQTQMAALVHFTKHLWKKKKISPTQTPPENRIRRNTI